MLKRTFLNNEWLFMKNMLQIIAECQLGGAEKHTKLITQEFARIGYKVYLLFPPGEYSKHFFEVQSDNLICIEYPLRLRFSTIFWLRKFIKDKNIKLIHSHMHTADILSVFSTLGLKEITIFTTIHYVLKDLPQSYLIKKVIHALNSFAFHRMKRVFTVSDSVNKIIKNDFNLKQDKVVTTLNSINFSEMEVDNNESKALKDKYSENGLFSIIISSGTLSERKNQIAIIEAFKKGFHKKSKLLLLGEGPQKEELQELVRKYELENSIIFLGFQKNVATWLSIADIYCQLSLIDPLPRALLEAMYMKLPIVASDIDTLNEVIVDQKTGISVNPTDYSEINTSINELLDNTTKRIDIGKAASEFIVNNCSMETMARKIKKYI